MKYKKLTIHNIASIQDAEIDFEKAPLSQSSLFLIAGKTGVGKSTILDAICLALYNNAPRLKSAPSGNNSAYEDSAVNIGTTKLNEPKLLVRRGASEAYSILHFEGNDGIEYVAKWHVKKTKSRKNGEWYLSDEKLSLEQLPDKTFVWDKKTEVLNKIESVIGLNFEQFCRTSLLAQGEFTKFLKADDKEKANILEKLTSTEIYAQIGTKIAEKNIEAKAFYEGLKSQMGNIHIWSEEEIETQKEEVKKLSAQNEELSKEREKWHAKKQWLENLQKLNHEKSEIEKNLQATISELGKEEVKELRKIISDWELSANARIALSDKRKLSSSLIDCEQKLNNLALAIPHYISGIKYEQEHLRKMQASLSEKISFLDSQKEFEKMFEKRHVIVDQLSQLKGNKLKIKTLTNELHAITQSRGEKNLTIKAKMEVLSGYEQKIAEADTQIKQLDAQLKGMDHDSLLLTQKNIQEKLSILKEAFFLHQNLLNYRKEYDSQKGILEKNRSEQEKSLLSVKSMSLLLKESEEKMNEKKRLYETMLVSIGDIARQLRHKLSQGDKCPVCGQTVHQIVSDEEFEAILNPLKSDFQQAEETYKKNQQDWLALNASIAEKKKTIEQMEKELSDLPSKLEENENMLLNRLSQLSIQDIKENLAEELNCLQSAQLKIQKENEEKIKSFSMLQKAKDESEKNFKMILGEFQKGQSLLNKLKDESSQIEQNLAALTSLLETTQNEVLKLVNRLSEEILWDDWHKEIDHTEERLKREADHFFQTQKDAQKLSVEIEKGNEYLSRLTSTMDKLINDEIVYDSCPAIMMNDLEGKILTHIEQKIGVESQIKTLHKNISEKESVIANFLKTQMGFTEDHLALLTNYKTEEIEVFRKKLELLDSQKLQLSGQLKGAEKQIADHQNIRPKDWEEQLDADLLSEAIVKTDEVISQLQQQIGSINKSLQDNEKRKMEMADLKKQTDQAYGKASNWALLNDIFGTKDGSRFKSIAQSYILQELLSRSNGYLGILTNRYQLSCQLGSYAILVIDKHRGGEKRPAITLSGGESFMISLSLALGLSSLAGTTLTSDIVFIDEGFGSLSEDALEPVINMLSHLSQLNGKKVGVISHVEQLKQNIDSKILLTSEGAGAPTVVRID